MLFDLFFSQTEKINFILNIGYLENRCIVELAFKEDFAGLVVDSTEAVKTSVAKVRHSLELSVFVVTNRGTIQNILLVVRHLANLSGLVVLGQDSGLTTLVVHEILAGDGSVGVKFGNWFHYRHGIVLISLVVHVVLGGEGSIGVKFGNGVHLWSLFNNGRLSTNNWKPL